MTQQKRKSLALGLLLLFLLAGAAWSINHMLEQEQAAALAADDLATCRNLATAIRELSQKPALASSQVIGTSALGELLDAASQKAGFQGAIESILPQPPRPVGDSPYAHKPTALSLRGVSLSQLATFLYHLTVESGWNVYDLRLRRPNGDTVSDAWDAEVTITYLIYSPPKAKGVAR